MNADFSNKEETDLIIGSALSVLNEVGHGYHEKPDENGLTAEFRFREIPFVLQPRYPIFYGGVQISEFVPDLIAYEKIIVDAKVSERITDQKIGLMLNHSKSMGLPVGLILKFKNSKLEFRRVVATTQNFIRRNNS